LSSTSSSTISASTRRGSVRRNVPSGVNSWRQLYPVKDAPLDGDDDDIIVSDIALKTRCFGLHFCCRKFRYIFNHFYAACAPKSIKFAEIMQNSRHYAVQGHSRSPIFLLSYRYNFDIAKFHTAHDVCSIWRSFMTNINFVCK